MALPSFTDRGCADRVHGVRAEEIVSETKTQVVRAHAGSRGVVGTTITYPPVEGTANGDG